MSAKLACVGVIILGSTLGSCLPTSKSDDSSKQTEQNSAELTDDAPLEIAIMQFPASYFGQWGLTPGDCKIGASDAKGLISVQGSLVKFYEATATIRNGKRESLTSVSGNFDFVGEGQKWQTRSRYQLRNDKQQLTRHDIGTAEKYVYSRCPE